MQSLTIGRVGGCAPPQSLRPTYPTEVTSLWDNLGKLLSLFLILDQQRTQQTSCSISSAGDLERECDWCLLADAHPC